jgi:hypothetical protein
MPGSLIEPTEEATVGRETGTCAAAVVAVLCFAGCSGSSEYEEMRQAALDAAVAEFDADSLGEVVCDVSGGEAGLKVGFTQQLMFRGTDDLPEIMERLRGLDYSMGGTDERASGARVDGILASITVVQPGDSSLGAEPGMYEKCEIPAEGGVSLRPGERDVGVRPSAEPDR